MLCNLLFEVVPQKIHRNTALLWGLIDYISIVQILLSSIQKCIIESIALCEDLLYRACEYEHYVLPFSWLNLYFTKAATIFFRTIDIFWVNNIERGVVLK